MGYHLPRDVSLCGFLRSVGGGRAVAPPIAGVTVVGDSQWLANAELNYTRLLLSVCAYLFRSYFLHQMYTARTQTRVSYLLKCTTSDV